MKLGSLFDGSGGFPLAGVLHGIEPVWASEIEPYPIRVTKARFPHMKQLGDVTKINGAEIEPVDIITFGSPCQDLSVAGKQKGIHEGERSNLFFEAVRIIKEMRKNDEMDGRTDLDIRPRFAVWENVPGAFSSNGGEDFRAVLEALGSVREDGLSIPRPARWNHAGCVVGDGWSIAWRVYDAQYWGVPQRRKRIYLIADFGTERAGEILFEREGVRGDTAESRETGQGAAADAKGSVGGSGVFAIDHVITSGGNCTAQGPCYYENICQTEKASGAHAVCYSIEGHVIDRKSEQNGRGYAHTLNATDRHGVVYPEVARSLCARADSSPCVDRGQNVVALDCRNMKAQDISGTLQAKNEGGFSLNFINPICTQNTGHGWWIQTDIAQTMRTPCGGDSTKANLVIENSSGNGIAATLDASYYKGTGARKGKEREIIAEQIGNKGRKYVIRRLTPLECCRLQGLPDWWEDGVEGSDSARYKMWGNGIALPCAADVMGRIANAVKNGDGEQKKG